MALILSIETSTSVCSVALHRFGQLLALAELNESGAHAEKIMLLIEQVLTEANVIEKDLQAIAVSEGPGSYTGLRIGVSTAKGLAYGLDLPLLGINTLQALATVVRVEPNELIVPVLDARRMEVYCQTFDSEFNVISDLRAEVLEEGSFGNYLEKGRVYFMGDAVAKLKEVVRHGNAVFREDIRFSAAHLGGLAFRKYENQEFEDIAYFVPNYLKEFKALHSKKNPLLSL